MLASYWVRGRRSSRSAQTPARASFCFWPRDRSASVGGSGRPLTQPESTFALRQVLPPRQPSLRTLVCLRHRTRRAARLRHTRPLSRNTT